jgi:hypothetical protein
MPTYETGEDKSREREVANWLENRLGSKMVETRKFYPVDFFTYSNKHSRFLMVEIKCRNVKWDKYPSKFLSMEKMAKVVPFLQMGVGFALVISCEDKVGMLPILHASSITQYEKAMSMNKQPDGTSGPEFVAMIPNEKFTVLEK